MGAFHRERCSDKYKQLWSGFLLESIRCSDINPIFYQSITEKNVIRFIGGYILRALKKKMERSLQPLKKELLLCLSDLLEDDTATYVSG